MINSTDSFVIAWRCWYDNGTSTPTEYNSVDNTLYDLPDDGFQAMRLWYSNDNGRFISGNNYYFFADHAAGTIFGQSDDSYESIQQRYSEVIIKRGKHVPEQLISEIIELMTNSIKP